MRFTSLAHTSDGKHYIRHDDVDHFEVRLAAKVGLAALLVFGSEYAGGYMALKLVLIVMGLVLLFATLISTYILLKRDGDAHAPVNITPLAPALGGGEGGEGERTIPVIANGVTTQMTMDPLDDALVALIVRLLDASIMLTSGDVVTFPSFLALRSTKLTYNEYDEALRGLGSLVKRKRGSSPIVVHPHTLGSVRKLLDTMLPYRPDAPQSGNRIR